MLASSSARHILSRRRRAAIGGTTNSHRIGEQTTHFVHQASRRLQVSYPSYIGSQKSH